MRPESSVVILLLVGLVAGIAAGLFGIGGGLLIVPALVYLLGYSHHLATGTSLVVLLPPVGIAAVLEYHRHGQVDFRAALLIVVGMLVGGWIGAHAANRLAGPFMRLVFGVFVTGVGIYTVVGAVRHAVALGRQGRALGILR